LPGGRARISHSRTLQTGIDAEVSGANNHLKPPGGKVEASYQHYWRKSLRSSAFYSYAAVNNTDVASAGITTMLPTPAPTYLESGRSMLVLSSYGWAMDQNVANAPRIQFSAKYSFVKTDPDR
jgi:hypothetical protein